VKSNQYDVIHLLSSVPTSSARSVHGSRSPSPDSTSSSWADLPSDEEERFYLSGSEELSAYERKKKSQWMEALRAQRVAERVKEEVNEQLAKSEASSNGWGGDDEEPPPAVLTLMSHTAQSLSKSPNPRLLELRILTNHSTDERFAFLRGRWKNTWERVKVQARKGKVKDPAVEEKEKQSVGALIGGYASDSAEDDDDGSPDEPEELPPPPPPPIRLDSPGEDDLGSVPDVTYRPEPEDEQPPTKNQIDGISEEEVKRIRRQRAEEWKRQRAAQSGAV